MPDYQQRPQATDAEGEQVPVCPYLEADISRCISSGRRTRTYFTVLGFIWRGENTATGKTLKSWPCPQGPPFGEHGRVCAADRAQLFQDLSDTQAPVFSVSHVSLTSRPQDTAASAFDGKKALNSPWEDSMSHTVFPNQTLVERSPARESETSVSTENSSHTVEI